MCDSIYIYIYIEREREREKTRVKNHIYFMNEISSNELYLSVVRGTS